MDAWNPSQYDKFKQERSQPFFDLLKYLQPIPDARVIDLGCGTGELTKALHQHMMAKSTLGIDNSQKMLDAANRFSDDGLHFELGDIAQWEPKDLSDVVFSNAALQWCEKHRELFAKLTQWLEPAGQLAVQMPFNHDYPTHVLAHTMSLEKSWVDQLKHRYDKNETMLTQDQYEELLFGLGYREVKVEVREYRHLLESREQVIEWVRGTLLTRFQSQLTESQFSKFLDEYKERLFKQLPDSRPFTYPFKRIFIWGRK